MRADSRAACAVVAKCRRGGVHAPQRPRHRTRNPPSRPARHRGERGMSALWQCPDGGSCSTYWGSNPITSCYGWCKRQRCETSQALTVTEHVLRALYRRSLRAPREMPHDERVDLAIERIIDGWRPYHDVRGIMRNMLADSAYFSNYFPMIRTQFGYLEGRTVASNDLSSSEIIARSKIVFPRLLEAAP